MADFKNTRYIYTPVNSDDRGIAWSKYILAPIIVSSVPISQVYADQQVGALFSIDNDQDTSISINFIKDIATYHTVLSVGNLENNFLARNVYDKVLGEDFDKTLSNDERKIYADLFKINISRDGINFAPVPLNQKLIFGYLKFCTMKVDTDKFKSYMQNPTLQVAYQDQINAVNAYVTVTYPPATPLTAADIRNIWNHFPKESKTFIWPNLNTTKYFNKKFAELGKKQAYNKYTSDDLEYEQLIPLETWFKGQDGIYYRVRPNDVPEAVNVDDTGDNCFNLNVDVGGGECESFLSALLSDNEEFSKGVLKDVFLANGRDDVWYGIYRSIKNIHPVVVIRVLEKFGFRVNTKTNKVRSVAYWLKHYAGPHFGNSQILTNVISHNDKLLRFLDLLVHFINFNPGILDPNYVTQGVRATYDIKGEMTEYAKQMGLEPRKDTKNMFRSMEYLKINKNNACGNKKRFNLRSVQNLSNLDFGAFLEGMYGGNKIQYGGKNYTCQLGHFNHDMYANPCGNSMVRLLFEQLIDELTRRNKSISPTDAKAIDSQLKNLEIYERRIYKTFEAIENYIKTHPASAATAEYSDVTLEHLENEMNKLRLASDKYEAQEFKLIDTLNLLTKMADEDVEDRDIEI